MFTYQKGIVRTSVRHLVEFLLREGDIVSQGSLVADTESMQAGSRIHRKIQNNQKITYRAEVPLRMEWEEDGYRLLLEGRADGIDRTTYGGFLEDEQFTLESYLERTPEEVEDLNRSLVYIDEIKGIYQNVQDLERPKKLHLAQAQCYAAIYCMQKDLEEIGVQMTYCNMDSEEIRRFHFLYNRKELTEWFEELIDAYRMWAGAYVDHEKKRQASIDQLAFPFDYRQGQKKLLAMVYHSITQKKKVFFQAPTGIGKTISTIYPALKVMGKGDAGRIFYLTAKTIARTVAEDTLTLLQKQGLDLKSVTLTAKEKMCTCEEFECNPLVCERARGHFDRINQAIFRLYQDEQAITREKILDYALQYQVCPYQLSLEVAAFSDFVICDYNYVFDPHVNHVNIRQDMDQSCNILLIDEAHNLVERAREMYSAVLTEEDLRQIKKLLPEWEKSLHKKLNSCLKEMNRYKKIFKEYQQEEENPQEYMEIESLDSLYFPLFRFLEALLEYLTDHPVLEERQLMTDIFFRLRHFQGILENMTEGYRNYGIWSEEGFLLRLYCIDPSEQLKELMEQQKSAILFSATLLPMAYYRNLLYGPQADAFFIPSPFDREKRRICIASDVTSRYSRRNEQEYRKIISYLEQSLRVKKGNYMIFFPSYDMMEKTLGQVEKSDLPELTRILVQKTSMDEKEKEAFLDSFQEQEESLLAFCVLGSIFSEGIDLSGRRLIGVFIVGTGLPGIGVQQDIIRSYFDKHGKKGYDYAYRYPGMNKVLQAAGRVIRTVDDEGVITLLDDRFLRRENLDLLPEDWDQYYQVNLHCYSEVVRQFWNKMEGKDQ